MFEVHVIYGSQNVFDLKYKHEIFKIKSDLVILCFLLSLLPGADFY